MASVTSSMAINDAMTAACNTGSPSAFAIKRMTAPRAPGPAISGVARGNTEISCFDCASFSSSSVVEVLPEERANTRSMPISSKRIPPPVRRAAREMPRPANKKSPTRANNNRIDPAIKVPRTAICRRRLRDTALVNAAYIAATSKGPMVAKKVAKATPAVSMTNSFIFGLYLLICQLESAG